MNNSAQSSDSFLLDLARDFRAGLMNEEEYNKLRQAHLDEHYTSFQGKVPAVKLASPIASEIKSKAQIQREEAERIANLRASKGVNSFVPSQKREEAKQIQRAVIEADGTKRLRSDEEIEKEIEACRAEETRKAAIAASTNAAKGKVPGAAPAAKNSIPAGFEIRGNIVTPPAAVKADPWAPLMAELRAKVQSGELTANEARAQLMSAKKQAAIAGQAMVACKVCAGKSSDLAKLCMSCKGDRQLKATMPADRVSSRQEGGEQDGYRGRVDHTAVDPDAVSFTCYDALGRNTTLSAHSGDKAIKEAIKTLLGGNTFNRAVLNKGCALTFHGMAVRGKANPATGKYYPGTKEDIAEGNAEVVSEELFRIYFDTLEDAEEAGRALISEEGLKKTTVMTCPACNGAGKFTGCKSCKEKGRIMISVVYHVIADRKGHRVAKPSPVIYRADLLVAAKAPAADPVPTARQKGPVCQKPSPRHDSAKSRGGIAMRKSHYGSKNYATSHG